jgi:hypothetical protein
MYSRSKATARSTGWAGSGRRERVKRRQRLAPMVAGGPLRRGAGVRVKLPLPSSLRAPLAGWCAVRRAAPALFNSSSATGRCRAAHDGDRVVRRGRSSLTTGWPAVPEAGRWAASSARRGTKLPVDRVPELGLSPRWRRSHRARAPRTRRSGGDAHVITRNGKRPARGRAFDEVVLEAAAYLPLAFATRPSNGLKASLATA